MFIREVKTVNKKTGMEYITHKLVESVRTEHGPRQRIVMELGSLTLPKVDWKRLAHALECRLMGQESLLETGDEAIESLALSLVSSQRLSKRIAKVAADNPDAVAKQQVVPIDLESVQIKETRSVGAELLCAHAWDLLGLTGFLKTLRFSPREITAAKALVFGRMIAPGSERHTIEWFRKRSALAEFPDIADLSQCGKNLFYEVGDLLLDHKDRLEQMLYTQERTLFPHTEATVFLYDITNTYLEGHALGNTLAARGHCKSKRFDCPLLTLSLVVDDEGMPILSQVFRGNQSEPETMPKMMLRLTQQMQGHRLPLIKPTVVMDRGIATIDNVTWLRGNGYEYIVIKREDGSEEYRRQFEEGLASFELIREGKKSVYGEENNVYIRQEQAENGKLSRVLCISEGRARKERAIDARKERPFLEAIANFQGSIEKGTIKNPAKIEAKLIKIATSHARIAALYEVSLERQEGKITGIRLVRKQVPLEEEKLYGCSVIESSRTDLSGAEIWKLYTTLSRVESAFRSMKESLGVRPVYHQKANRASAHLFISVLAYHLLATIENLLTRKKDTRTWGTVREVMSTLMRGTVLLRDAQGSAYHLRLTGQAEDIHQDILDKLGIRRMLPKVVAKIG